MKNLVHQIETMEMSALSYLPDPQLISHSFNLIVDALFGFSFKPPVREPFVEVLDKLKKVTIPVASIDIPSGKRFPDFWLYHAYQAYHLIKYQAFCYHKCHIFFATRRAYQSLSLLQSLSLSVLSPVTISIRPSIVTKSYIFIGWLVDEGPTDDSSLQPDLLISLTAPKLCAKRFRGRYHFLGGRFVPPQLASKYDLNLPAYPGTECVVELATPAL